MKGHKKHRGTGGANEAADDLKDKPEARTDAKKIDSEAEERKAGGRTARKHGGEVHRSGCKCEKCMGGEAKKRRHGGEAMKVEGEHAKHHAGHKPRKSGGRATSDANPFTSARAGKPAPGRKVEMNMADAEG